MARPTKALLPVKQEAEESQAHEQGETPDEEKREGTEDAPTPKTSRKRSPRGAKNTKAPMDAECNACKSGKTCSCKAKKDGGCGSYGKKMDRNDALTPHEYLAACELGIQGKSRPYIRARLDAAERLDLKCGAGSISPGEKCTKGGAQNVDPKTAAKKEFSKLMSDPVAANSFNKAKASTKGIGNKVKAVGEFAARLGGGAAIGAGVMQTFEGGMRGNLGEVSRGFRNMQLGAAATQVAAASKASRMGKKELSNEFLKSAGRNALIGVGQEAAIGGYAGFKRTGGAQGLRQRIRSTRQAASRRASGVRSTPHGTGWASSAYDRPIRGRRDSVYAAGFTPDLDQLAL